MNINELGEDLERQSWLRLIGHGTRCRERNLMTADHCDRNPLPETHVRITINDIDINR